MPLIRWEYDYIVVKDEDKVKTLVLLDEAGEKGWEFTGHSEDNGYAIVYLMKRNQEWREHDDNSD